MNQQPAPEVEQQFRIGQAASEEWVETRADLPTPKPGPQLKLLVSNVTQYVGRSPHISSTEIPSADRSTTKATMTEVSKDLLDARLEAIEARMDGRIAAIEGKFDRILATMDRLEGQFTEVRKEGRADDKTTRITIVVTGITVVLGIAAFNATVLSNMVASFESGRNTALAIAEAMAQAHPGAK